jgi:hypothetical protein
MNTSTTITSGGLVTFTVKTNGNAIPETINVQSIEVEKGVNRIPIAKIVV